MIIHYFGYLDQILVVISNILGQTGIVFVGSADSHHTYSGQKRRLTVVDAADSLSVHADSLSVTLTACQSR